jgi:hypothetical protein
LGFKVSGKVAPETEKPEPATVAALTVIATVPVEDKVSVCVVAVFTFTLPKARLVALMLSVGTPVPSCRANVVDTPLALAVSVTVCVVLTAETVAVKLALVAPAATVTEAGTVTALLLLARLTAKPPLSAAAFSVTVQLSVPAPVIDALVHVRLVKVVCVLAVIPVPLRPITIVPLLEALLVIVNWPVAVPVACGENCTLRL